ncbi:MAG: sigma-54 dependent transcriptional regulator [Lysobacterales bacterium]
MRRRALVVDDEPSIRELVSITLGRLGLDVDTAATVTDARALLGENAYSLCLTDMRLPDGTGQQLVEHVAKAHPQLPIAVITAFGNLQDAVIALKAGAFDFVSKPVDLAVLRRLVQAALKLADTKRADGDGSGADQRLLGDSPAMRDLRAMIAKVARSQAPVYISGESGSGKELVARLIHESGPRTGAPFVPVNCGAIPSELMESEFFGHVKGSFTGAHAEKQGLFAAASGGTLFLDEVADLPLHRQVKLLRAIQEKSVRPVGANREVSVDVRLLSATHRDLTSEVAAGKFRQDLFYRINVIELRVPPLRDRGDDILSMSAAFLARHAQELGLDGLHLSQGARDDLLAYPFPGNVRELENILERAVALSEGNELHAVDLRLPESPAAHETPPRSLAFQVERPDKAAPAEAHPASPPATDDLESYLGSIERELILKTLQDTKYNRTKAAEKLGITFRALRYKLQKLGIE